MGKQGKLQCQIILYGSENKWLSGDMWWRKCKTRNCCFQQFSYILSKMNRMTVCTLDVSDVTWLEFCPGVIFIVVVSQWHPLFEGGTNWSHLRPALCVSPPGLHTFIIFWLIYLIWLPSNPVTVGTVQRTLHTGLLIRQISHGDSMSWVRLMCWFKVLISRMLADVIPLKVI